MGGKRLITERDVAERASAEPIVVGADTVITPAALDMAQQHGIPVVWADDRGGGCAGTGGHVPGGAPSGAWPTGGARGRAEGRAGGGAAGGSMPWTGAGTVPARGPWSHAGWGRSSALPPAGGAGTRWDVAPPASLGGGMAATGGMAAAGAMAAGGGVSGGGCPCASALPCGHAAGGIAGGIQGGTAAGGACACPFAVLRQEGRYVVEVRGGVLRILAETPGGLRPLS